MPTLDDLDTARDEDGDGHPGVTLAATTLLCEQEERLYAALRVSLDLDGEVLHLDHLAGDVRAGLDQSVLGTSAPCLAAAAELPLEVVEGSTFSALRVGDPDDLDGNGNVSCNEIVAAAPALLGGVWAPAEP